MTEQQNLELQIRTYDANYRAGTPLATDAAYDKLVEELAQNFPNSDLLMKGVIRQPVKASRKQKLPLEMYSLNKCKSYDEIMQWIASCGLGEQDFVVITPKFDGISLVANEFGNQAWTRGDGEYGQDSRFHFNKLKGANSPVFDHITFGEAIMPKKNFEKYKGEFANPRNMVAGLFNRDITTIPLQDVHYVRYGMDSQNLDKDTQIGILNGLSEIKCPHTCLPVELLNEELFDRLFEKWGVEYQIDGLVIDINSKVKRQELGREENMNPVYARAFKNPKWSGTVIVPVEGIKVQVSKQGKLKPVVMITPTEFGGVTISNVTGYNFAYVFDNNIAKGSMIEITRSGDVIPKHLSTVSYDKNQVEKLSDEMSICPCCSQQVRWDETMTEIVCSNPNCAEMNIMKLVHFFETLGVEEFGEPSVRRFWNAGYRTVDQIMNASVGQIIRIDGFGESFASKLLAQFDKLRTTGVPFAKTVHAVDVMEGKIGEKTIQLILDNLFETGRLTSVSDLIKINGVAESTALTFIKGWQDIDKLPKFNVNISYIKTPVAQVVGDKFAGWKICFTGVRPSKEKEAEIQSQGGEIVSGVSKTTTHLVVKDLGSSSSKMVKAKELGIQILTLNQL